MVSTKTKILVTASLLLLLMAVAMLFSGCGYNRQIVDLNYNFNYAIINTFDGTVEGKVSSWRDFEDGDQIQLTIDGVTYLTHSSNVILEHR